MFSFIMFPWAPQEILILNKVYANDQYLMVDLNENSNKSTLETDIQILLLSHASSHLYILHYSKWEKDHALSTLFD